MWTFDDMFNEFGIRFGPFGMAWGGGSAGVKYDRTESSHLLRIRLGSEVSRKDIKVRLVKPGVLEIEWPRKLEGEEIPVE
mgnify:CR=1 FL=1